ncbi:tRNA (N6-isopentenyl adenosine(37)-C2)-methylthiotransferase MiaB [bacterium]|nr:tRNA (N6-isopentenyl adenosine(37)-C2)-methylthiotransferase MiaB [bacterium]
MENTGINHCPKVWMETYGCQMNKSDSELVAGLLTKNGYDLTARLDMADIALVNTCSVRSHAEQRVLGRLGVLAGWKRKAPNRIIAVLGCMAQKEKQRLLEDRPFIDLIVGPDGYRRLPRLLEKNKPVCDTELNTHETYSGLQPLRNKGVSGWVTIMRGCNNFCSYCIVPYTRGRERSRSCQEIEAEISEMTQNGFREITLLGQNVNSYQDSRVDFPELLKKISRIPGLKRVRFMTSHPKDCSSRLLEIMAAEPVICPHLHLAVQSGSNRILQAMNRKYSREHFFKVVDMARYLIPELAVTTDVMVGFPGETIQDFQDTIDLMQTVKFDDAFMYHYSPRPGTKAAEMKNQISQQEKLRRLNTMIGLQQKISASIRQNMVGKTVMVIPEATSKRSASEWIGKTGNNHMVVFPKSDVNPGMLIPVKIDTCIGNTLRGIPVQNKTQTKPYESYKITA